MNKSNVNAKYSIGIFNLSLADQDATRASQRLFVNESVSLLEDTGLTSSRKFLYGHLDLRGSNNGKLFFYDIDAIPPSFDVRLLNN